MKRLQNSDYRQTEFTRDAFHRQNRPVVLSMPKPVYGSTPTFRYLKVKNMKISLKFPVAVDTIDGDFIIVDSYPDLKAWADFNDGYKDSAAGKAEEAWYEVATCLGGEIWQIVDFE